MSSNLILENYLEEIYLHENILSLFTKDSFRQRILNSLKEISKSKIKNIDDLKRVYNKLNFIPVVEDNSISKLMTSKLSKFQQLKKEASTKLKMKDKNIKPYLENIYVVARYLEEEEEVPTKVKKSSGELIEKIVFWTTMGPIGFLTLLAIFMYGAFVFSLMWPFLSGTLLFYFICFVLSITGLVYFFITAE